MVFLRQALPRKRPSSSSSSSSSFPPPKIPKPTSSTAAKQPPSPQNDSAENPTQASVDKLVAILADAGCTLINPAGPPCLPSDLHKFRAHLNRLFSSSSDNARSDFLAAFSSYIRSPNNLRRILISSSGDGFTGGGRSLVRQLLLVPAIQPELQSMLLEKLPEYFDLIPAHSGTLSLEDDVARLIINQFRWLDFMVDPNGFADKLMQVLSICPPHLKKEIIGSLPEIIGDQNNKAVVDSLEEMLREDSSIIVPVLDAFSNLNLDEVLQEQVLTIALSCIRTIDGEHMPYLLRYLLLSATSQNVRRIVLQIREQLKFVGVSHSRATQNRKLKGKSVVGYAEASILDALRSSLLFRNTLCQEILKQLTGLEKPTDHKVIDIWLLVLIHMNGEAVQKSVEKIFKKKVVEDCIEKVMIDQCICGDKELVQDYFPSFLSLSEYLLTCKDQKAREFGIHIYTRLFEELGDTYCRQEVLGALVAHVGSGVSFEVNSALETLVLLASKYAQELIPLSSHINGILDYLEAFDTDNLHKVYEAFSKVGLSARSSKDCFGSSIANELLMIVRKQVSHPDLKYKKMGIVGALKLVSCLGDANNVIPTSSSQKSNSEEALELLRISIDSCKQMCLPLVFFYDELAAMLDNKTVQPPIMDWIGKHVGEFESAFLADLDGGQLPSQESYSGLDGELWMNLDGDISPVCLSILPLAASSLQSTSSLQILPANFLLLATVERLTNQGSLAGIDALLGCPLHLPAAKHFSLAGWQSLTPKQKQIACLSLYYAANWIRELLNAFCTQVAGRFECTSQATKEDIIAKLFKRLRSLIFLESLLNNAIKCHPLSLPDLHLHMERLGNSALDHAKIVMHVDNRNDHKKPHESSSQNKRKSKIPKASTSADKGGKFQQPTILDVLRKVGVTSQEVSNDSSSSQSSKGQSSSPTDPDSSNSADPPTSEVSAVAKYLEPQKYKFRPLLVQCHLLLMFPEMQCQDSCCSDPTAKLPLYLFLLRDLHSKLDYFAPVGKQFPPKCMAASIGFTTVTVEELLSNIRPLFPHLKTNLESAISALGEGDHTCEEHWKRHSTSAGNPEIGHLVLSKVSVSTFLFKEVLHCFSKMLNLPYVQINKSVLSDLLEAFQPSRIPESMLSGIQPTPSPGTLEYLYIGVFSFIEKILDKACSVSFILASESLVALQSIVASVHSFLDKLERNGKSINAVSVHRILPSFHSRIGMSAQKILRQNWDDEHENSWKNKGDMVQKILRIYLENSESTSDLLEELACSILPQVSSSRTLKEDHHGYPTLCNTTFLVWCRVLHEVNLTTFNKLVKEVGSLMKPRAGRQPEKAEEHLIKIQKSVNVVVSLVNLCRKHDKVAVHAMAVKFGGKFVDSFLKVFDFLQAQFQTHNELIIQLVKELQKATRTVQTLCSEAKGLKQTIITSKIPATKRSMERFLFHVKALLHTTPSGCTFWMGNLKHKDLAGQVVSSQAYVDEQSYSIGEGRAEAAEDQPASIASEDDEETE